MAVLHYCLIIRQLAEGMKRRCKTARLTLQNGAYWNAKRGVSHCQTAQAV